MRLNEKYVSGLRDWLSNGAPEDKADGHAFDMDYEWTDGDCGSACCMAGYVTWLGYQAGECDDPSDISYWRGVHACRGTFPVISVAAELLRMPMRDALALFYPSRSDRWLCSDEPITPQEALAALDYFLDHGVVDWDAALAD